MREDKIFHCSFCRRPKNHTKKLIAGKNPAGKLLFICDICVNLCYEAIIRDSQEDTISQFQNIPKPKEIYEKLCEVVEGQNEAKKTLATVAYNHYKRVSFNMNQEDTIGKTNVLLLGKSGSGKTLIAETLGKILDLPVVVVDATTVTETGYVGDDASNCLAQLLKNAKEDVLKAQKGIVVIDEVDKIRKTREGADNVRDISGGDVQNAFLRLMEGTTVEIPLNGNKKYQGNETVSMKTNDILFICAGAFESLLPIVSKDINIAKIGFIKSEATSYQHNYGKIMHHLTDDHLIRYGMIPEFLGRLHIKVVLDELTIDNLVSILTKPKNALLKQYQRLLKINDNAGFLWTDEALIMIAKQAIKSKTGARGLRAIVEKLLGPAMFEVPSMEEDIDIMMDKDAIKSGVKFQNKKNASNQQLN